mgnify:CR=1 FL=1
MDEWKKLIVILVHIRSQLMEADKEKLWEYHLPGLATTKDKIEKVQKKINLCLSEEYKEFLLCANGWPCFYQMVDLFGTNELMSDKMLRALKMLSYECENNNELLEINKYLLPVAVSRTDMDLFVMVLKTGRRFGEIIWLAGGEIDRFESFKDFFKAMIEYNKLDLEDAKNGV